ncbi:MAG: response regulator [Polyangiaceae bacterium]|nr:response regulator [Polyangiaceae bacterium]
MQDGKYVILCVDDDPDIRDSLRIILEANGYLYVGAATAEEGLKAYKQSSPDLMVVDLMMEEVDAGTSFVKELKLLGCRAPVYMLSSVGDSLSMSVDYGALGLSGVLQKPVSPENLLKLLREKLG